MKTIDVPSSFLLLLSSSSTSSSTTSTSGPPRSHRLLNLPTKTTATSYISLYNSLMKLVFLASSAAILYLMRGAKGIRQTYDAAHDTFRVAFLVAPAALLALWLSADRSSAMETAWTFSILLEAVAILPQLVLLQRTGNVDNLTGDYVFLLGTYRGLYVVNWFYRWMTEPGYKQWLGELVVWEREGGRGGGEGFFSYFFFARRCYSCLLCCLSHLFFSFQKKKHQKKITTSVDLRDPPDGPVPRLLLLLPPRVEEQREAQPSQLRRKEERRRRRVGKEKKKKMTERVLFPRLF